MEIEIKKERHLVLFWLTKADSKNEVLLSRLKTVYPRLKKQGYLSAVYISGEEDLYEGLRDLLIHNMYSTGARKELSAGRITQYAAQVAFSLEQDHGISLQKKQIPIETQ